MDLGPISYLDNASKKNYSETSCSEQLLLGEETWT